MMQLVVPEALSFPCAKLVKAMAALISLQYVSSLPFTFSFCAAPTPPLPLMISGTHKHAQERKKQESRALEVKFSLQMNESGGFDLGCKVTESPLTCHIYLIHGLWFLKVQEEEKKVNFAEFSGFNEDLLKSL